MLRLNSTESLTINELKEKVPSAFMEVSSDNVSGLYKHINTSTLINDMKLLGWHIADAKEVKARKTKTKGFQKHLIVFMNEDLKIIDQGEEFYPQILLVNSHDARSSFTFIAGLFRTICENGLVISIKEFENLRIRHMGYDFDELQNKIKYMVEKLPLTIESMNKMKQIQLNEEMTLKFAKDAIKTRFEKDQLDLISIDYEDLLEPKREEDKGDSLWVLYNLIQEKIISGDFVYTKEGRNRKARRVKNISKDIEINKELFNLAYEYTEV